MSFWSKFIQKTVCQISPESPEVCRKLQKKTFWSLFSGHSVVSHYKGYQTDDFSAGI